MTSDARARIRAEIEERAERIREERRSGRGWIARLMAALGRQRDAQEREDEEARERALHDPFAWSSFAAFRRARAKAGLKTAAVHPRYPPDWNRSPNAGGFWKGNRIRRDADRSPYKGLDRWT